MATVYSTEITAIDADETLTTRQLAGRVRIARFTYTAPEAHADGSDVVLVKLPANRVTVLGPMSSIKTSAFGSSRVGKIGYAAHTDLSGTAVAADDDALALALDLSSAAVNVIANNIATAGAVLDIESQDGVRINLTVTGGTIPSGATIKGYIAYVVD